MQQLLGHEFVIKPVIFLASIQILRMESPQEEKFVPKGAMAFFVLLVVLALLFWYGIYILMIERT